MHILLRGCPCAARLQVLASTVERMKNFAVTYLVDISEVPDFNAMYELYDPCTVMFFFRNKVGGWVGWVGGWRLAGQPGGEGRGGRAHTPASGSAKIITLPTTPQSGGQSLCDSGTRGL